MEYKALEAIANLPEVRPWLGGTEPISLEDVAGRPGNFLFANEDGGYIVTVLSKGIYEAHTIFRPDKNLREAIRMLHEAQEFMFVETDCIELVTKVPQNNPRARWYTKIGRFEFQFTRKDAWSLGVDVDYFNLPLDRWARACSPAAQGLGASFHATLEHEKLSRGISEAPHPQDDEHDKAVGLAVMMIKAGNVTKGVDTYNRWAAFTGYGPLKVLWQQPLILDTGDAVIQVRNGEMEIMACR